MTALVIFAFAGLLGLVVGSFLNVVIHRGPALWGLVDVDEPLGSLWGPRSQCPSCKAIIKSWDNIPLLSYGLLKGKCAQCAATISPRYPLVELLGAVAAIVSVYLFGWTIAALLSAVFLFMLIALGFIDLETGYLPDMLTLPLILIGLGANFFSQFAAPMEAIFGAVAGFVTFWLISLYYYYAKGREGLGLGDAKLLGALGAWSGWVALAPIVMIASISALMWVGLSALRGRKVGSRTIIHFGPALTMAGAIVFIIRHWPQA